jgi:hypothetical protein
LKLSVVGVSDPSDREYVTTKGTGVALVDAREEALFPVVFLATAVKV